MDDGTHRELDELFGRLPSGRRLLLGIAGPPGGGKSTFARDLAQRAAEHVTAAVVPMDGFHLPNARLDARGMRDRKGAPHTFDVERFVRLLDELRRTPPRRVTAPKYDRDLHEPVTSAIEIGENARLVIVEGNYLLLDDPRWGGARRRLDEVWYIATPIDEAMRRIRARHIAGGCTPAEAEAKVRRNDRPNAELVENTRHRADRVIT